jgi:hypothetical protein
MSERAQAHARAHAQTSSKREGDIRGANTASKANESAAQKRAQQASASGSELLAFIAICVLLTALLSYGVVQLLSSDSGPFSLFRCAERSRRVAWFVRSA